MPGNKNSGRKREVNEDDANVIDFDLITPVKDKVARGHPRTPDNN